MSQGLWQRQEIARHPLIYQSLRPLLPELEELLPQMEALAVSPEQEQLRLWEATRALLDTISESAPLLIVLDDLQWADSSSCELLAYLVRQLRGHPILIAGTCRDIELPPAHPLRALLNDLQREQAIETITVQPLSDEQIRALVSGLPEPVVQHIQVRAAGNPFFAEELARNTSSTDSFVEADLPSTLPDTISAVLDLRLGRISSACLRMLVRAAVFGGSFEFSSLRAMESGPSALDEDSLLDLLEEALQAGMLTEEGSGTRITYHFWHPLLVSHLYDGLSAGRRASLHRRAAEVLRTANVGREAEAAAAITYHLLNGGADSADIARYAELAGDRAYTLSAYPEAEKHYRLTVEHLGTLSLDFSLDEHMHLANILERLGECTRVQGKPQEARHFYEQALEERSNRHHLPSKLDSQYEAQIDALLWVEIGITWFNTGDYMQARQCYIQSEEVLQSAAIITGSAWAELRLQQSYVLWQEGSYEEAVQTALQALEIFTQVIGQKIDSNANSFHPTTIRHTLAGNPVDLGRTRLLLGTIAAVVGQNTKALDHLSTALAIFEQYDRHREIAIVCCNIGDLYLRKTEYTLAQAALRRSLSVAERIGDVPIMSVDYGNLGVITSRFGNLPEAENLYKRCLALTEQMNDPVYISLWNSYLSQVIWNQGKFDEARSTLCRAFKIGRTTNFTPCIGFALVTLGNLRTCQAQINQKHNPQSLRSGKLQVSIPMLRQAKNSLEHALRFDGLEAETRTEGQLALAHTSFLLGKIDIAKQQIEQVITEAQHYEQTWLLGCALRLLGSTFSLKKNYEKADACFIQSLEILRKCEMRLEEARSLRSYGESLLQRADKNSYMQGLSYLQEARSIFKHCHAEFELQLVVRQLEEQEHRTYLHT